MARCEVCDNDYDKSFEVIQEGQRHVFDSFEWRDPCAGADVLALPVPDHWARIRGGRQSFLLCQLRPA